MSGAHAKLGTATAQGRLRGAKDEAANQAGDRQPERAPPTPGLPEHVRATLGQAGTPLPGPVKQAMQARFGQDFSAVRVHADERAAESAAALDAKAYTHGPHIVFGSGRFAPERSDGRALLAHELAHVVQQSRGGSAQPVQDGSGPLEASAHQAAQAVVGGNGPVSVGGASATGIACEPNEEDKKKKPPLALPAGKVPLQLPPGPVTVDQVMSDPSAAARFHDIAARTPGKHVKDEKNVQGKIFEEMMNQEVKRRIKYQTGMKDMLPNGADPSKLEFVQVSDPSQLKPGQAMFVEGSRIQFEQLPDRDDDAAAAKKSGTKKKPSKKKKDPEPSKLEMSDGMIITREGPDLKVLTVFEGKSGSRRASDLHRTESGKEEPTKGEKRELGKVQKEKDTGKIIGSELGGQVRRDVERLTPDDDDTATILIDGKKTKVKSSPSKTLFLGVVPKDVDISASTKRLASPVKPKKGEEAGEGIQFRPFPLESTEHQIRAASAQVIQKAQPDKAWALPGPKKDDKGGSGAKPASQQGSGGSKKKTAAPPAAPTGKKAAKKAAKKADGKPARPKQGKAKNAPLADGADASKAAKPAKPAAKKTTKANKPADKPKKPASQPADKGKKPPAAKPPATKPPATKPPVAKPPVAKPPVAKPPVAKPPVAKPPAAKPPAAKPPAAKPPAAKPPAAKPPAAKPNTKTQVKGSAKPIGSPPSGGTPSSSLSSSQGGAKPAMGPGKMGMAGNVGMSRVTDHGKGRTTQTVAAFSGMATIQVEELPLTQPPQVKVTFLVNIGGQVGFSASKEGAVGAHAGANRHAALTITKSYTMSAEESRQCIASAQAGKSGGWNELRVAELAASGSMGEAKTLLARLKGGATKAAEDLKENEEISVVEEDGTSLGGGVSGQKGRSGLGFQLGYSTFGSVQRHAVLRDGKYLITVSKLQGSSKSGSVNIGVGAAGMNVGGSDTKHNTDELTFSIDEKDPQRAARIRAIMSAPTMEALHSFRNNNKDVPSWASKAEGGGTGQQTGVSLFGISVNIFEDNDVTARVIEGPDGVTRVYEGTGKGGGNVKAGDTTLLEGSTTNQFVGGATPDNKGFGESTKTNREKDYGRSAGKLWDSTLKSPLGTASGVLFGSQPVLVDKVDMSGVAMGDDSYARLIALAAKGEAAWAGYWEGSMGTREDWIATYHKVVAAGNNRALVAKAMAEFEGKAGRGRHETVRAAVGNTAAAFEFPDAIANLKPSYDSLVLGDPISSALAAPDKASQLAKLKDAYDKLTEMNSQLKAKIEKDPNLFERPGDFIEMRQHIDARRRLLRNEMARLTGPALAPKAAAAPQPAVDAKDKAAAEMPIYGPPTPDPEADPAMVAHRKWEAAHQRLLDIGEILARLQDNRTLEQGVFAAMEAEFKGTTVWGYELPKLSKPDSIVLLAQERKLKEAYPKWDKDIKELRQLYEAGGLDQGPIDALKPNRKRYLELDAKVPHRGAGYGLQGHEEI